MICSGCRREIEIGDRYITDRASGFIDKVADDPVFNEIAVMVFGGEKGKLIYCEDCTEEAEAGYSWETHFGEEDEEEK